MRWYQGASCITILLPVFLHGQQVVFDTVRFNSVGSFAIGHSVFEKDTGYVCLGREKGQDDLSQDIYMNQVNATGGFISETSFPTYQQDDYGQSSPWIWTGVDYRVGVVRFGLLGIMDSLFLIGFDANGDATMSRFIDVDTTFTMRGTAREADGDILLCGLHQFPEEAYVYHLDSTGNIKGYHGYLGFDGEDVVVGTDGFWYVCGQDNADPYYGQPVVIRSDTSGGELWRRTDSYVGFYQSLIALGDSGVLAIGGNLPDPDTGGFALAVRYSKAGIMQWRKQHFQTDNDTWPSRFTCGFEQADGTIMVGGWFRSIAERDKGMLVKLGADGEVIWRRLYSHYPGAAYGKDQIFWDVKPTSDGGYVLTGETNSDDYPFAQLWLLKLDSMGCLVPGCESVGVEEYTDLFQGQLSISPNPASDVVQVSLSLPGGFPTTGTPQWYVLDAQGRVVLRQVARENLNIINGAMDVSGLSFGTYYIHLTDTKRWLAGGKLIVH